MPRKPLFGRDSAANLIIGRYLIREVSKPFGAILAILIALFASYSASGILADAVNGLLPIRLIAAIVGLKALISLEVLIPISLFLSVVLSFSRLYGDSEFTAMFALGVTPGRIRGAVFALSATLAVAVGGLSTVVRPLAYRMLHALSRQADILVNVNAMEAGVFYVGQGGNRVIFVARRDGPNAPARDVFVQIKDAEDTEIIYAKLAYPITPSTPGGGAQVYMHDAHIYKISHDSAETDQVLSVQGITVDPDNPAAAPPEYSSVATSSARLAGSNLASDVAEFQWRLSTPVSTILLGMLGIPVSRTRPRQTRFAKFGAAILIYAAYYLVITSARTWVQHGVVGRFPGIWWAPALLALALVAEIYGPRLRAKFRRDSP